KGGDDAVAVVARRQGRGENGRDQGQLHIGFGQEGSAEKACQPDGPDRANVRPAVVFRQEGGGQPHVDQAGPQRRGGRPQAITRMVVSDESLGRFLHHRQELALAAVLVHVCILLPLVAIPALRQRRKLTNVW